MSWQGWLVKGAIAIGIGKYFSDRSDPKGTDYTHTIDTMVSGAFNAGKDVVSNVVTGGKNMAANAMGGTAPPATTGAPPAPGTPPSPGAAPAAPAAEGEGFIGWIKDKASKIFGWGKDHPMLTMIGAAGAVLVGANKLGFGQGLMGLIANPFVIAVVAATMLFPPLRNAVFSAVKGWGDAIAGKGQEISAPSQAVQIEIASGSPEKKTTVDINSPEFKKALDDAKTLSLDKTFTVTYKGKDGKTDSLKVEFNSFDSNNPHSMHAFYTKLNDWEKDAHPALSRPQLKLITDPNTTRPTVTPIDLYNPMLTAKILSEAKYSNTPLQVQFQGNPVSIDLNDPTGKGMYDLRLIIAAEQKAAHASKPKEGWRNTIDEAKLFPDMRTPAAPLASREPDVIGTIDPAVIVAAGAGITTPEDIRGNTAPSSRRRSVEDLGSGRLTA